MDNSKRWNKTKAGTKPLVTTSARESSWSPKSETTFSFRAINPSKKSNKIPKNTKSAAVDKSPSTAKITAIPPDNKFSSVTKFGTNVFKSNKIYLVKIINYFCFS